MVEIKVSGLDDIIKKLAMLRIAMEDMTGVFKDIADAELGETKKRFVEEVDPQGKRWSSPFSLRRGQGPETANGPRRSSTAEQRWNYVIKTYYNYTPPGYRFFSRARGDKALRDSGRLFNSIGRSYGKDYAVVGTNVEYADKHQFGEGVKKREFIGTNNKTIENIDSIIMRRLGLK